MATEDLASSKLAEEREKLKKEAVEQIIVQKKHYLGRRGEHLSLLSDRKDIEKEDPEFRRRVDVLDISLAPAIIKDGSDDNEESDKEDSPEPVNKAEQKLTAISPTAHAINSSESSSTPAVPPSIPALPPVLPEPEDESEPELASPVDLPSPTNLPAPVPEDLPEAMELDEDLNEDENVDFEDDDLQLPETEDDLRAPEPENQNTNSDNTGELKPPSFSFNNDNITQIRSPSPKAPSPKPPSHSSSSSHKKKRKASDVSSSERPAKKKKKRHFREEDLVWVGRIKDAHSKKTFDLAVKYVAGTKMVLRKLFPKTMTTNGRIRFENVDSVLPMLKKKISI